MKDFLNAYANGASIVGMGANLALDDYSVATHTIQTLVPAPRHGATSISSPTTDGRYINWSNGTGEKKSVPGAVQVITESDILWVYDTQTHQRFALETFQRQPNETSLETFAVPVQTFQGMALWEKQHEDPTYHSVISSELHLTNIATRADQVISANDGGIAAASWPQLLYGVANAHCTVTSHLKNLQTGADQTLPNLPEGDVASMLAAGRVYGIHQVAVSGTTATVKVEELLQIGSPQAHWVTVTTLTDVAAAGSPQDYFFRINDHVIVYQAARFKTTFVNIVGRASAKIMSVKSANLTQERWLIMQMDDGSYDLFDTAKLP